MNGQELIKDPSRVKQLHSRYKDVLTLSEKKDPDILRKEVVLFFSFDIVNSTSYKTVNYYGWARVLNLIFKKLRGEVASKINFSQLWRILGDEAIFVVKIKEEEELRKTINKVFEILVTMIDQIKTGNLFDDIVSVEKEKIKLKLENTLSLKAAAWIAVVADVGNGNLQETEQEDPELENIFERYQSDENYEICEFLGNDIDAGFRIAEYTLDGKLVLSYELAYLLSKETDSMSCLNIITYKRLKGIWKEKLYPIIWYHNPKVFEQLCSRRIELEESFAFDAREEYDLIKEYFENRDSTNIKRAIYDERMFTHVPYAFNKILEDRGLKKKIDKLQEMIKVSSSDQRIEYFVSKGLQMHCAVVCFKQENDEISILLAKRSSKKAILSGKWEFGGAKISKNISIVEQVKKEYKDDFKIDVEPILDRTREDSQPIPLALYQVKSPYSCVNEPLIHKGIIILAKVKNAQELKINHNKHEDFKWVTESNYKELLDEECVADLVNTLECAFKKIKECGDGSI